MVVHDDGSGPALYAGGFFLGAGGVAANRIAKWDGGTWSALSGPDGAGMSGSTVSSAPHVLALAVYDDGGGPALYAGGDFTTAGGVFVKNIAKWDGTAWSALPGPVWTGTERAVHALAVYDDGAGPALYVGGEFVSAGGEVVYGLAKWNGSTWSALNGPGGSGVSCCVSALAVYDDGGGAALYAAGNFGTADGLTVNYVARWDGSAWSALSGPAGTGTSGGVAALAVYDDGGGPALYAGGFFTAAGGVTANHIAKWDGAGWSALSVPSDTGVNNLVGALAVWDDGTGPALFAGGSFIWAGGVEVNRIAKWDGDGWSRLSGQSAFGTTAPVYALAVYDDHLGSSALYAGGAFGGAGGNTVNQIARWDGAEWSELSAASGGGMDTFDYVRALAGYDDGTGAALYAGGNFIRAGDSVVNAIARWDGESWSGLGGPGETGVDGVVNALAVFDDGTDPALYVGGSFWTAGGVSVNGVAKWDGQVWSALSGPAGTGLDGGALAFAVYDDGSGPALYAGGGFPTAGGVTVNNVARWDGTTWSALSGPTDTGLTGAAEALAVYDDGSGPALYAAGSFVTAGGVTVNNVAKWDGTTWSALSGPGGSGTNFRVEALAAYDDGGGPALYAGGWFTFAGGVAAPYIAKWDGNGWSAVGFGTDSPVFALGTYDNGGGVALVTGGWFEGAGAVDAGHIVSWNGTAWSPLSGPAGNGVASGNRGNPSFGTNLSALAVYDDGDGPALYAGGRFFGTAGGLPSRNIARWLCTDRIFSDGFESGDLSAWSGAVGGP